MIGPPAHSQGHILIVGPSKTGTTGAYTAVKQALLAAGVDAISIFEPRSPTAIPSVFLLAPGRTLLTKTTINKLARIVPDPVMFDRRIMTVRDPRDMLISNLLFRPLTRRSLLRTDSTAIHEFVAALESKEADPAAVSVRELFELADRLGIGATPFDSLVRDLKRQLNLTRHGSFHVLRYEHFVAGDLGELSEYLGTAVEPRSSGESAVFGHIARSATAGDYAHWFRPDDLAYFDSLFGTYIGALGYDRAGQLAPEPVIDPAVSSEYVRSRFEQRRADLAAVQAHRSRGWSPDDVTDDELDPLVSAAGDGDPTASLRVAQVLVSRKAEERGGRTALQWARLAAELGAPAAMSLTADLLEGSGSADPAIHREAGIWRTAHEAFRAEQRLADVHRSNSYRVGTQLALLARSPRRNGRAATRELAAIWRQRQSQDDQRSSESGNS